MTHRMLTSPRKLTAGDRVAVLSPSVSAPAIGPAVHDQAMRRLVDLTGLVPVEYPTTRRLGASAQERAADLNAAFGDPTIRGVLATLGGDDQVTVVPYLDAGLVRADPKPFLGYSDNTNLLNWLWCHGVRAFYGGSTQVHLGAGPAVDAVHAAALRAALLTGGELTVTDPGESEDFGPDWADPRALTELGEREPTDPWSWAGPQLAVSGRTWGGCLEVIDQLALAGRLPDVTQLAGTILLLETSEELPAAAQVRRWVRALGERGVLSAVAGVVLARPPASAQGTVPPPAARARWRADQRAAVLEELARYNPEAVVCVGVPFGHTRPQWILPYGGTLRLDGRTRTVTASYD